MAQQQIFRRIAAQRKLGRHDQLCAAARGRPRRLEDRRGVAAEIADDLIQLRDGDLHATNFNMRAPLARGARQRACLHRAAHAKMRLAAPHQCDAESLSDSTDRIVVRDDVPIEAIDAAQWDALATGQPLASHAFLAALHSTGCASRGHRMAAALSHARGAAQRSSARCRSTRRRTPTASTCSTGAGRTHSAGTATATTRSSSARFRSRRRPAPRLLAHDDDARAALLDRALKWIEPAREEPRHRSRRCTFCSPTPSMPRVCERAGMTMRSGVQFRWSNPGYRDFADFLATFNHDKRKKVQQERRKLAAAGVIVRAQDRRRDHARRTGRSSIAATKDTYRAHHSTPYLSLEFFLRIGATMPDNLLLVDRTPRTQRRCAPRSTSSTAHRCGAATGARSSTFRGCISRRATTRRSSSASSAASRRSKAARRACTSSPADCCPRSRRSAHAIADPAFAQRDRGLLPRASGSTSRTCRTSSRRRARFADRLRQANPSAPAC